MTAPDRWAERAMELIAAWDEDSDGTPKGFRKHVADALREAYEEGVKAGRNEGVEHARKCCYSAASIAGLHSRKAYDAIMAWVAKDAAEAGE
jgi:flagellar biosynthesis/type III secretory pathway protein FliH